MKDISSDGNNKYDKIIKVELYKDKFIVGITINRPLLSVLPDLIFEINTTEKEEAIKKIQNINIIDFNQELKVKINLTEEDRESIIDQLRNNF